MTHEGSSFVSGICQPAVRFITIVVSSKMSPLRDGNTMSSPLSWVIQISIKPGQRDAFTQLMC